MKDNWNAIRFGALTGHEINQLLSSPSPQDTRLFRAEVGVVGVGVVGRVGGRVVGSVFDAAVAAVTVVVDVFATSSSLLLMIRSSGLS